LIGLVERNFLLNGDCFYRRRRDDAISAFRAIRLRDDADDGVRIVQQIGQAGGREFGRS
jgi:hypothetical protein